MNLIGNINAIPFRRFRGGGGVAPIPPFPSITGMIARYSALGLTNEQMAENPVWKDLTGNGHDLQMKNFAWKGMSGFGGYVVDIDEWGANSMAAYYERNSIKITATFKENASLGLLYHNIKLRQSCVLKVTGIPEGCDAFLDDRLGNRFYMSEDGVYEIIPSNFLAEALYLSIEKYPERWYRSKLTIEQLPLYPGALVFDGVDDYGICDNFPILTKEKGYTVVALRQYLFNATDKIRSLVTNAHSSIVSRSALTFELIDSNGQKMNFSFGRGNLVSDFEPNVFSYMTSKSYNGKTITPGDVTESNKRILVGNFSENGKYGSNVAIWELVFLDHDATEEELTKIKDYFVKTYPWLFPDQAWTVTGKTNEGEDRATIANITGNGNNLVLSNFGFAGNSGYGEYAYNWNKWGVSNGDATNVSKQYNKFVAVMPVNQSISTCNLYSTEVSIGTKFQFKLKITGLTTNWTVRVMERHTEGANIIYEFDKDGTYQIDHTMTGSGNQLRLYIRMYCAVPNTEGTTVTIEQIPEYEGYLVTDGVDDKIESKQPFQLPIKFSMIGSWVFIKKEDKRAGISKENNLIVYDKITGLTLFLNSVESYEEIDIDSFHAISSDGKLYDENWNMLPITVGSLLSDSSTLKIAYDGNNFVQFAFNCMGFYDKILKKDDLLKGWIYLKGLKAQRIPPSKNYILKEDGGYVLQEDGNKILTEQQ